MLRCTFPTATGLAELNTSSVSAKAAEETAQEIPTFWIAQKLQEVKQKNKIAEAEIVALKQLAHNYNLPLTLSEGEK